MNLYSSDYKIVKIFFTANTFKGCLELALLILIIFISQIILKVAYFLFICIKPFPGTTNIETKVHVLNHTFIPTSLFKSKVFEVRQTSKHFDQTLDMK